MATNHVHQQQHDQTMQGAAVFGAGHDGFDYNNLYVHGQHFPHNNVLQEQQNPRLNNPSPSHASPYNPTSAFSHPSWQPSAPATSISNPPHGHQFLTGNRGYYGAPNPSIPNAYLSGGPQYTQHVDPSLNRHEDARLYAQSPGVLSPAPPSNPTISPAALYQPAGISTHPSSTTPVQSLAVPRPASLGLSPASTSAINGTAGQSFQVPKGTVSGNFVIVSYEDMAKATNSAQLGKFVNVARIPIDLNMTKINAPAYAPRKSQNEIKALAASDPAIRAKLNKRLKKHKIHVPRTARVLSSAANKGSPVSLSSVSDSSDYDSDSSYGSDSSAPERTPLPQTRPPRAVEAVRYDTMKAVWSPRNRFPDNDRVLQGLADLWEVVRTTRERWVSDRDAVKEALKAKKDSELPLLRERVDKQLEMMETILKASVDFGHPDILSACGQNTSLMLALYSFLVEFVREAKYTATFVKAAFKFLSTCTNLNTIIAKKSSLDKLIARAVKRGTDEIKALANKIEDNIAASDKKEEAKAAKSKSDTKINDSPKPLKQDSKIKQEADVVAGVKRARPAESTGTQAAKRVASGLPTSASKDSATTKLGLVKKPPVASAVVTTKPKVAKPTTSFFSGLQSASKKPGTTNAALATRKPTTDRNPVIQATAPTPARPIFSFAETMANLSKERQQEPAKVVKQEENQPLETEEEKKKRLRKEARRHLRVQWKADNSLVEIRTFKSDPSEMPRQVRDVRDGQDKEGLTFKQHIDMMDVDVDDEDDQPTEQTFFDFYEPQAINLSALPSESQQSNYERYGGRMKPESPEKTVQDNHEANNLIAHYMVKSDIPANPREPADPYAGVQLESKDFGQPAEAWLVQRLQKHMPVPPTAPPTDISALLQAIGASGSQVPPVQQPAQPPVPDLSALSSIVASINAAAPPQPTIPQQQPFSWSQPPPIAQEQPRPLEAILAELSGNPIPQPVSQPSIAAPPPAPDVSSLIAQLMQSAQAPANPVVPSYAYAQPDSNYFNSATPQSDPYNGHTNQYEQQGGSSSDRERGSSRGDRGGAKWRGNPGKKFLLQCRFWDEGKCKKGADCTFRHD